MTNDINKKVVIIAEDIEILVLPTSLIPSNNKVFLNNLAQQNKPKELYSSKSLEHFPSLQGNILLLHNGL